MSEITAPGLKQVFCIFSSLTPAGVLGPSIPKRPLGFSYVPVSLALENAPCVKILAERAYGKVKEHVELELTTQGLAERLQAPAASRGARNFEPACLS